MGRRFGARGGGGPRRRVSQQPFLPVVVGKKKKHGKVFRKKSIGGSCFFADFFFPKCYSGTWAGGRRKRGIPKKICFGKNPGLNKTLENNSQFWGRFCTTIGEKQKKVLRGVEPNTQKSEWF